MKRPKTSPIEREDTDRDPMPTLRVFQVAKLLKVDSEEILDALSDMGISVTSNLAQLDEAIVVELKELFKPRPQTSVKAAPVEKKPAPATAATTRPTASARAATASPKPEKEKKAPARKKSAKVSEEQPGIPASVPSLPAVHTPAPVPHSPALAAAALAAGGVSPSTVVTVTPTRPAPPPPPERPRDVAHLGIAAVAPPSALPEIGRAHV